MPTSIKAEYLADKDRTRVTIVLANLSAAAASPYRVASVELRFVSQFHGTTRPPDAGESVIDGSVSLLCGTPGALAVSSPVGSFLVDGQTIEVRPGSSQRSAYSSKRQSGGGAAEKLSFKIDTRDFLTIAAGSGVTARFGSVDIRLSPGQLADLREFAAGLKPGR